MGQWVGDFNKTREKNLFQRVAVEIINVLFEMGKLFKMVIKDDKIKFRIMAGILKLDSKCDITRVDILLVL